MTPPAVQAPSLANSGGVWNTPRPVDGAPDRPLAFCMSDDRLATANGCALTLLLLDAARAVEARAEGALAEVGLSLAKLGALRHLVLTPEPLTLSQLAERHCCGK